MTEYSKYLYARFVNPGTEDEYTITGPSPSDVSDTVVGDSEPVAPVVARYVLAGTGEIHMAAPMYVELTTT